jgi:1,2-diacylglycerol 3-beta-glucosyltransferase
MTYKQVRSLMGMADMIASLAVLPAGLAGGYLGVLSLLSVPPKPRVGKKSARFAFVVPAHNEELSIAQTIRSLSLVDYPQNERRIIVVADNCTDQTADVAQSAGAQVLVRNNVTQRGKGYALALAFAELLAENEASRVDAVVVVDADTTVSANILQAFAAALESGEKVLQATYRVANHDATWRTSLMAVAFTCMHDVRSIGRERLKLSTGLRGNGMCFSVEALERVPHHAASLVEDVEHGLDLAAAGIRVAFVHEATVEAEMPEHAEEAASQRTRWEQGRTKLRRERLPKLVAQAIAKRDPVRADLALDLIVPPLARIVPVLGAASVVAGLVRIFSRRWPRFVWPAIVGSVGLAAHVAMGWKRSGTGVAGIKALFRVPGYILWKLGLQPTGSSSATPRGEKGLGNDSANAEEWVRTTRNAERTVKNTVNNNAEPTLNPNSELGPSPR